MADTELIHVRVPRILYKEAEKISDESGFSTLQEFFRYVLRRAIERQKQKAIIKHLKELQGSVKNIKRMSREEKKKCFEEYLKKDPLEILGKYGLY